MPMFNTYLMVDWSAAASPAGWPPGADSIWWAAVQDRGKGKKRIPPSETIVAHERTRSSAIAHITDFLEKEVATRGRRVLVGFDFAFGYPCGFAKAALGQELTEESAQSVWQWLATRIRDDDKNANNRFRVAAELNAAIQRRCSVQGPFWGRPEGQDPGVPTVNPYADGRADWELPFRERRITEGRGVGDTVWHLFSGASVVGSQSLMGLPHLEELRRRPTLRDEIKVWPIETGFGVPSAENGEPRIVVVEIYPSLLRKAVEQYAGSREISDRAQVRLNALAFSLLGEQSGGLDELFVGPTDNETAAAVRKRIASEEGWILGFGHEKTLLDLLDDHFRAQARRHQAGRGKSG